MSIEEEEIRPASKFASTCVFKMKIKLYMILEKLLTIMIITAVEAIKLEKRQKNWFNSA